MVARVALSNMRQGHEEPIRSFQTHLKAQADTCKYEMTCTKVGVSNSMTEEILCDVIARGIADQEIQLDLLGEKNQDMPLKDMIEYEAKETWKHSAHACLTLRARAQSVAHINSKNSRMSAPEGAAGHRNQRPSLRGHASTAPGTARCAMCAAVGITSTMPAWVAGRLGPNPRRRTGCATNNSRPPSSSCAFSP